MKFFRFSFVPLLVLCLLTYSQAHAFPEMVRDGYVNCTACHYSPNGGGILTQYGRQLSGEILSTWSREGETEFLWNLVKPHPYFKMGGDVRAVQTVVSTPQAMAGNFILMQADFEGAVDIKNWKFVGTVGRQFIPTPHPWTDELIARRFYLNYRPNDQWSVRVGKFQRQYGINFPDHIILVRADLGWDQGTETYNVEGAWLGDQVDAYVTAIFGRPDTPQVNADRGFALSSSIYLANKYKLGMSYYYGVNNLAVGRHVFGPFGILGFTPHFFLLAELDFQNTLRINPSGQWGFTDYLRLDYEFFQGFHGFFLQEFERLDFSDPSTVKDNYGIGVQWFPRPHFEFQLVYERQRQMLRGDYFTDYAYLLLHYYL